MNIEQLKQEWQQNSEFNAMVEESVIKRMLANKNKGALNKIIKNEKEGVRMMPLFGVSFILISLRVIIDSNIWGAIWVLMIIPIGVGIWYWGKYLINFLEKIDMGTMSTTEVYKRILKYKEYLIRHATIAGIFMPIYLAGWLYFFLGVSMHDGEGFGDKFNLYYSIFLLIFAIVLFCVIMWHRYFKHVNEIKKNLEEVEEFIA